MRHFSTRQFLHVLRETISLQTPRGRLLFFIVASAAIFLTPYDVLGHLSIWQHVGFDRAPSIGLTRAYWLVLHLDISSAYSRNPLIFVVLAIGLPLLIKDALSIWKGRQKVKALTSS